MQAKRVATLGLVALAAAGPSYLVERVAEFYFFSSNPEFFFWSGERTPLFIVSILFASIISGNAVRSYRDVAGAFTAGVVVLVSLLYVFCATKACFSTGVDGLEPVRVFYFFASLGLAGGAAGHALRWRDELTRPWILVTCGSTIGAIAYYPVVFTLAGTRVLGALSPAPVLLVVLLATVAYAAIISRVAGRRLGFAVPVAANLLVIMVTVGVASQYLAEVIPFVSSVLGVAMLGAGTGCLLDARWRPRVTATSTRLLYAAVLLVFLSMAVFLPDAVAGVAPSNPSAGASSAFNFGTSVYVGGFATQSFARLEGVSVSVSFAGTNLSSIQADNYLSGGLGIHAADCCTDGIDYGYRFDVYLFHGGSEAFVASSWQDCDWIMACGGHSWQNLLFLKQAAVSAPLGSTLHLFLSWEGRSVYWSYAIDGGPASNFTFFNPPAHENAYFTVGTLGGIPKSPVPPQPFEADSGLGASLAYTSEGYYFFQYGLMSAYPIGHSGWSVTFSCPSFLTGNSWTCVNHSDSIQGDQSFWKAIWRWGETYPDVMATSNTAGPGVTFAYSSTTMPSFRSLW